MRVVRPLTSILDAVYSTTPDRQAWVDEIRAAGERTFDGCLAVQVFEARFHPTGVALGAISSEEPFRAAIVGAFGGADSSILTALRSGASSTRAIVPRDHALRAQARRDAGIGEVCTAHAFADPSHMCGLSLLLAAETSRIPRPTRLALSRISAHLASAYRLRIRDDGPDDGDAVLTPEGSLVHAEGDAKHTDTSARLRAAALGVARSRGHSDPEAGLELWRAMVAGRWTLVERFESDGKRLLVARPNAPEAVVAQALSAKERAVVERAALGGTMSLVAYELGLPESTVHMTLSRAIKKLGLATRAQLLELRAALVAAAHANVDENGSGA